MKRKAKKCVMNMMIFQFKGGDACEIYYTFCIFYLLYFDIFMYC